MGRERWQALRLDREHDHVGRAGLFKARHHARARLEISFGAFHLDAVFLHGTQVWAAGEQGDVEAGASHARAQICADRSGACNQKFHGTPPFRIAAATAPRRIFPVAVCGMVSTM